jgi:hypothetical protein
MHGPAALVVVFALLLAGCSVCSIKQNHMKLLNIENRVDDDGNDDAIVDERPMIIYLGMDAAGINEFGTAIALASGQRLKTFHNNFKAHIESHDGFCNYIERDTLPAINVSMNGISIPWHARQFHNSSYCGLHAAMQYSLSTGSRPLAALTRLKYQVFLSSQICDRSKYCGWAAFEALDQLINAYPNAYYVHGVSNQTLARMSIENIKSVLHGFMSRPIMRAFGWPKHGITPKEAFDSLQNLFDSQILNLFARRRELKYFYIDWDREELLIEALGNFLNMKNITLNHLPKPEGLNPLLTPK